MTTFGLIVILLLIGMLVAVCLEEHRTVRVAYNEMGRGYFKVCLCPEIGYKLVENGTVMSFARCVEFGSYPTEYLRLAVEDHPFTAADLQEMVLENRAYRTARDMGDLK